MANVEELIAMSVHVSAHLKKLQKEREVIEQSLANLDNEIKKWSKLRRDVQDALGPVIVSVDSPTIDQKIIDDLR